MKSFYSIILFLLLITIASCTKKGGCTDPLATNYNAEAKKDNGTCTYETVKEGYDVPSTYTFNNVDYSGQTLRLQMLDMLCDAINAADTTNALYFNDLEAIYKNTSGTLFGSSKDLYSKTYADDQQYFLDLLYTIDTTTNGGSGINQDGYYVSADGLEIDQLVQKGLMGAVLYYQATSYYLENLGGDDNTNPGGTTATDMEHHMDEAFGYFAAPIDFNQNTNTGDDDFVNNANFWGKYALERNVVLNNLDALFLAFRTARAAISNEDYPTRDEMISLIRTEWEKIAAASIVHYINEVKADLSTGNLGKKYHHWSEGKGFAMCLKYNIAKKISFSDLDLLNLSFGDNPNHITSGSDFDEALTILKNTYGFTDAQMIAL